MTEQDVPKPEPAADLVDAADAGGRRPAVPTIQPVLMASVVAAIILMIAIGAFWTSF